MSTRLFPALTRAVAILALAARTLAVGPGQPILLWPGEPPLPEGSTPAPAGEEKDTSKPGDNLIAGRTVIRLGNVHFPTITVWRPPADRDTGTAVLVCPGGGYHILAMDLEGTEVCEWLNSIGVTGVLLKYRVPRSPGSDRHPAAFQDAQRALGLMRQNAGEWHLDPKRLGVLGFSAGGHLAATLSTHATQRTYPRVDAADDLDCRPDFTVLIYPGGLAVKDQGDILAPDLTVGPGTPPAFLAMAQDDPVRVEHAYAYAQALQRAKVPCELHVFPTGGHGYGLRRTELPVTRWPDRAADWMRERGWLVKK